jgi:IS30 family transposase
MNKQTLEVLVEQGLTALEIGRKTDKSESTVRRSLKKHELKTHRHNHHDPEATHRKCRYCGEIKSIEEFAIAGEKNGQLYRRWRCIDCYTTLKRNRRHSLRDLVLKYKKEKQCERNSMLGMPQEWGLANNGSSKK